MLIVIDQLPSWSFDPQTVLLEGGLRRLLDEGVYYPRAAFPYAITYTAPGHAALGTGAAPAQSGIMANRWYVGREDRVVEAVEDPAAPVFRVDPPGRMKEGVSSRALLVEGVADGLRRETGGRAHSVAIALKSRAAVLMLGKQPDLAIWYDADQVAMTTSRAYADTLPGWLRVLRESAPIADRFGDVWEPLDPERLREGTGHDDLDWGQGDRLGLDNTFPHALSDSPRPQRTTWATPLGNTLVLDAARAAIEAEALGADDVPDLLGLSFSAHDYAGHLWGQESWERLDMLLRLDVELEAFFELLDARVGRDRWAVVLTSDHGATPMPEHSERDLRGRRVHHDEIEGVVERAIGEVLGPGPWVAAVEASTVYLRPPFHDVPETERTLALEQALTALHGVDGVAFAGSRAALTGDCDARSSLEALVCNSLRADRSGDIYFAAASGSYTTDAYTSGTSHGSPNDHDRYVPIVVRAPGWLPARSKASVTPLQVAPTLATLLGIEPPPGATAPPLSSR